VLNYTYPLYSQAYFIPAAAHITYPVHNVSNAIHMSKDLLDPLPGAIWTLAIFWYGKQQELNQILLKHIPVGKAGSSSSFVVSDFERYIPEG
jgi:hypothetical protein